MKYTYVFILIIGFATAVVGVLAIKYQPEEENTIPFYIEHPTVTHEMKRDTTFGMTLFMISDSIGSRPGVKYYRTTNRWEVTDTMESIKQMFQWIERTSKERMECMEKLQLLQQRFNKSNSTFIKY